MPGNDWVFRGVMSSYFAFFRGTEVTNKMCMQRFRLDIKGLDTGSSTSQAEIYIYIQMECIFIFYNTICKNFVKRWEKQKKKTAAGGGKSQLEKVCETEADIERLQKSVVPRYHMKHIFFLSAREGRSLRPTHTSLSPYSLPPVPHSYPSFAAAFLISTLYYASSIFGGALPGCC